jgi:hypothetical protein
MASTSTPKQQIFLSFSAVVRTVGRRTRADLIARQGAPIGIGVGNKKLC